MGGPSLDLIDPVNCIIITGISGKAVNGFCGQRDKSAGDQRAGRLYESIGAGL